MFRLTAITTIFSFAVLVTPAGATEPLSATQLKQFCAASDKQLCSVYVTGFLDGAVATDARVAENVVKEIEESESFAQRAFRTRLRGRLSEQGPTAYADFCVGNPVPIAEVVEHVVEELEATKSLEETVAQEIVYQALRRHYPCQSGG